MHSALEDVNTSKKETNYDNINYILCLKIYFVVIPARLVSKMILGSGPPETIYELWDNMGGWGKGATPKIIFFKN